MDWETLYRRLVTRLEEIADAKDDDAMDDWTRVGCYDMVASAHARTAADLPVGAGEDRQTERGRR